MSRCSHWVSPGRPMRSRASIEPTRLRSCSETQPSGAGGAGASRHGVRGGRGGGRGCGGGLGGGGWGLGGGGGGGGDGDGGGGGQILGAAVVQKMPYRGSSHMSFLPRSVCMYRRQTSAYLSPEHFLTPRSGFWLKLMRPAVPHHSSGGGGGGRLHCAASASRSGEAARIRIRSEADEKSPSSKPAAWPRGQRKGRRGKVAAG